MLCGHILSINKELCSDFIQISHSPRASGIKMPTVSYTMALILRTFCEPICDKSTFWKMF